MLNITIIPFAQCYAFEVLCVRPHVYISDFIIKARDAAHREARKSRLHFGNMHPTPSHRPSRQSYAPKTNEHAHCLKTSTSQLFCLWLAHKLLAIVSASAVCVFPPGDSGPAKWEHRQAGRLLTDRYPANQFINSLSPNVYDRPTKATGSFLFSDN